MSAIDEDYQKLRRKIEAEMRNSKQDDKPISSEYQEFRKQYMPKHMSLYEKLCKFSEGLHVQPPQSEAARYEVAIETCHLEVTPSGAYSFALLGSMFIAVLGIILATVPMLFGGTFSLFFFLIFMIVAAAVYIPLKNLPFMFAEQWRVEASNQMILALFYITTYMRHTSNLENAIDFAADHIGPPLSLDLKKVIWNVQTEKYASLQESLDHYLAQWRETNMEFVQSMNLVQASLYESSQERRLASLEKAMNLMLDETYERMLHYAQNLKSPMTMLHMLGIILPILGLVILPLAVSFLPEVKWYHIAVLYNFLLPVGVFFLGKSVLQNRPSSYGNTDITEINPELRKYRYRTIRLGSSELVITPAAEAAFIGCVLVLIGLMPILLHLIMPAGWDVSVGPFSLLGYLDDPKTGFIVGPYGVLAALLSLCVIMGVGFALAQYYSVRSKRLIKIREETKALEQEFAAALFQLGNRLGDGMPAELAFSKVAESMQGTKSGEFFELVSINIQKMGMSVEQAIFDEKRGAILAFPSPLIESSMKVLIESSKKGPLEASRSLITMSNYMKEIHRVEERLRDLMSDIISGMRSQINFLTPAIAGIVIGITSMITTILASLQTQLQSFGTEGAASGGLSGLDILGLGIPTFYFQIIVGIYVIQITWILAYLVNGIENGKDDLNEEYEQGRGLYISVGLYVFISFVVVIIFNAIAATIMKGMG